MIFTPSRYQFGDQMLVPFEFPRQKTEQVESTLHLELPVDLLLSKLVEKLMSEGLGGVEPLLG